jgi:hypothetical protein
VSASGLVKMLLLKWPKISKKSKSFFVKIINFYKVLLGTIKIVKVIILDGQVHGWKSGFGY